MPKKEKVNEHAEKLILDIVRDTGNYSKAYNQAKISNNTFYRWMRLYPEFKLRVEAARKEYNQIKFKIIRDELKDKLEDIARNGAVEEQTTSEVLRDGQGNVVGYKEKTVTTSKPAGWAIEKVLGKDMTDIDAIKKIVDNGWLGEDQLMAIQEILEETNARVKEVISNGVHKTINTINVTPRNNNEPQ